jgi:methyl-accepting chemotaxis protein
MDTWVQIFIVVAAVAIVIQAAMITALFLQMKRLAERLERFTGDLESRLAPILSRVQTLLEDTQPKISEMVADAAHVVYLARAQAQKVDRVFTEASDRLRGQLVRADRILTGALEAVEDAGTKFTHSVWRPMHKVSALMQGIKVGIDLLRSRRGNRRPEEPLEQEEELFI